MRAPAARVDSLPPRHVLLQLLGIFLLPLPGSPSRCSREAWRCEGEGAVSQARCRTLTALPVSALLSPNQYLLFQGRCLHPPGPGRGARGARRLRQQQQEAKHALESAMNRLNPSSSWVHRPGRQRPQSSRAPGPSLGRSLQLAARPEGPLASFGGGLPALPARSA